MLYKGWTEIYEEDKEDGGEEEEREEEGEEEEGGSGGGGEEKEDNNEDDKYDDCVCYSVNKISNSSHISFLARTTLLIKSDSTYTQ